MSNDLESSRGGAIQTRQFSSISQLLGASVGAFTACFGEGVNEQSAESSTHMCWRSVAMT